MLMLICCFPGTLREGLEPICGYFGADVFASVCMREFIFWYVSKYAFVGVVYLVLLSDYFRAVLDRPAPPPLAVYSRKLSPEENASVS